MNIDQAIELIMLPSILQAVCPSKKEQLKKEQLKECYENIKKTDRCCGKSVALFLRLLTDYHRLMDRYPIDTAEKDWILSDIVSENIPVKGWAFGLGFEEIRGVKYPSLIVIQYDADTQASEIKQIDNIGKWGPRPTEYNSYKSDDEFGFIEQPKFYFFLGDHAKEDCLSFYMGKLVDIVNNYTEEEVNKLLNMGL